MSTPEEFEVKAQAGIASLRRVLPASAEAGAAERATQGSTASAEAQQPAPEAPVLAPAWRRMLKPALVVTCIAVAFLQFYYIDISLQIASLPTLFYGLRQ